MLMIAMMMIIPTGLGRRTNKDNDNRSSNKSPSGANKD